ncbi:Carboxylesterase 5A [Mactra antiquata]
MILCKRNVCLMLVLVWTVSCEDTDRQVVTVDTNVGTINGYVKETTYLGETYKIDRFQGIPYAEAPVGERRFMKALPKAPFTAPFDAFAHGSMCMQPKYGEYYFKGYDFNYSEDCLHLNIYAPHMRNKDDKLPVMVWIYGGAFIFGFSDSYLGDNIVASGNVIVVTFNYRVSLWGFLNTGNDVAPGNAGLWDQHMAIKWVNDNIGTFGGDTERVTIFGESAGSASVIYQALYPGNKGLFQRVIGQSGSVECQWASQEDVPKYTKVLASLTDCENDDSQVMVACLQKVSNDHLLDLVTNDSNGFVVFPVPFSPSRDDDFVKYDPLSAFSELPSAAIDMFQSVDLILGINSAEGGAAISPEFGIEDAENFLPSRTEYQDLIKQLLDMGYTNNSRSELIHELVTAEYTNWNEPDDPLKIREEFVALHSDIWYLAPLYNTADKHSEGLHSKTFMCILDFVPSTPFVTNVTWLKGLSHGEDLPLTFGYKSDNAEDDGRAVEWEKMLSKDIITLWTNFAKTGNPNKPVNLGLDWLPYTEKHQHYLHITRDMTSLNVKQRWNTRRANFWSKIISKIANSAEVTEKHDEETCEKDGGCFP